MMLGRGSANCRFFTLAIWTLRLAVSSSSPTNCTLSSQSFHSLKSFSMRSTSSCKLSATASEGCGSLPCGSSSCTVWGSGSGTSAGGRRLRGCTPDSLNFAEVKETNKKIFSAILVVVVYLYFCWLSDFFWLGFHACRRETHACGRHAASLEANFYFSKERAKFVLINPAFPFHLKRDKQSFRIKNQKVPRVAIHKNSKPVCQWFFYCSVAILSPMGWGGEPGHGTSVQATITLSIIKTMKPVSHEVPNFLVPILVSSCTVCPIWTWSLWLERRESERRVKQDMGAPIL